MTQVPEQLPSKREALQSIPNSAKQKKKKKKFGRVYSCESFLKDKFHEI
jgi:hypothetical protein